MRCMRLKMFVYKMKQQQQRQLQQTRKRVQGNVEKSNEAIAQYYKKIHTHTRYVQISYKLYLLSYENVKGMEGFEFTFALPHIAFGRSVGRSVTCFTCSLLLSLKIAHKHKQKPYSYLHIHTLAHTGFVLNVFSFTSIEIFTASIFFAALCCFCCSYGLF